MLTGTTNNGVITLNGTVPNGTVESNLTFDGNTLAVTGTQSDSTIFTVNGTQGQLFSVTDNLIGDIFGVNDISGIPLLTTNSDGTTTINGTLVINSVNLSAISSNTVIINASAYLYNCMYFNYFVSNGTNFRGGTLIVAFDNSNNIAYTDTSADYNSSTDIEFTCTNSGGNVTVTANIISGTWSIKGGIRYI